MEVALNVITVIEKVPAVVENVSSAVTALKTALHNVKVSKHEADAVERKLQGELFDKWHEKCEVMKSTKIPSHNLKTFLNHMEDAYDGVDKSIRKKMEAVLLVDGEWEHRLLEWKFNTGDECGARYGLVAFGKSPDQKYVDCIYVLYTMNFKISAKEIVTEKQHSILFGIYTWTTTDVKRSERKIGFKNAKVLQNFFRLKALRGFYNEGLIDSIKYVNSLDDIPAT